MSSVCVSLGWVKCLFVAKNDRKGLGEAHRLGYQIRKVCIIFYIKRKY